MNEPGDRNYPGYSRKSIDEANDRQRAAELVVPTSVEDQNTARGAWPAVKRFFGHQQVKNVRDSLTVLPGGLAKQKNSSAVTPVIHTVDRYPNHPSREPIPINPSTGNLKVVSDSLLKRQVESEDEDSNPVV